MDFKEMGLWINDKKPSSLSDMIGNAHIYKVLLRYIETGQLPNILFVGDNGVGKKTLAYLFAKNYLTDDYSKAKLIIDGAINRGKDTICEAVQEFARRRITMVNHKKKIIIITSFDCMTHEAQNALRRIMEIENSIRFILTTTDMSEIIEAIQSRCTVLKIKGLDYKESLTLIEKITTEKIPNEICEIISLISEGDIKRIVNYTQTAVTIMKITDFKQSALDTFYKVFNIPPMKYIEKLLTDVHRGEAVFEGIDYILDKGHNYNDIMDIISKILTYNVDILPEHVRYKYLGIVAEHYTEITATIVRLHMYSLFAKLALSV
jgi:DNA polymerase III delta prime subunit